MRIPTTHPALIDPRYRMPAGGTAAASSGGSLLTGPLVKEPARFSIVSAVIAFCICIVIAVAFRMANDDMAHWFIVPILACGVLCMTDAVDWIRGRVDTLDPVAVIGIVGVHFFMTAPLLHLHWDAYLGDTGAVHPPDWRVWFGGMGVLNLIGLLVYRAIRAFGCRRGMRQRSSGKVWVIDRKRFGYAIWPALLLTALAQLYVYASYGGLSGYISAYEALSQKEFTEKTFVGMGTSFTISESFPILAMMAFAVYARLRGKKLSWPAIFAVLVMFLVAKLLFGGLRGSRSTTLMGVVWAAGIVHFYLRPISKNVALVGVGFLILYLYVYGFYKNAGVEGFQAIFNSESRSYVVEKTGRSYQSILLGDLARADIQAFFLYRLTRADRDVDYAYGETYRDAATIFVPRAIWPDRPDSKRRVMTNVQYGKGKFDPKSRSSSYVTGMAGEAMLNFGPYFVPVVFILFSLIVVTVRRWMHIWQPGDARFLMLPFLILFCRQILGGDLDNCVFSLFKHLLLPMAVLLVCTKRIPLARYLSMGAGRSPGLSSGNYPPSWTVTGLSRTR